MKGDFSRDSFDPLRHYSRVLQQQGRVELDADGNEREAIQLHHLRSLAADLIGPFGGPGTGFELRSAFGGKALQKNFAIGQGHYYVDGWLCENEADVLYAAGDAGAVQAWLTAPLALESGEAYLAYLDVWERHVSPAEVDGSDVAAPGALREVALGGPDTTTRAQVVWQVKVSRDEHALLPRAKPTPAGWATWMTKNWAAWRAGWQPELRGRLRAKAVESGDTDASNPCVVTPQSRYRGVENQLYRIEIHQGGALGAGDTPTFVWSRENGSVLMAVEQVTDRWVRLADGWRDARFGISVGDVVELSDDDTALGEAPGSLVRVTGVDLDSRTISFEAGGLARPVNSDRHAVLRRWDHGRRKTAGVSAKDAKEGRPVIASDMALTLTEGKWLTIEDGISVFFEAAVDPDRQQYRTGDYWLIPARAAIGDILWPHSSDAQREPLPQPPHGVEHHYAPLAIVILDAAGAVTVLGEPTRRFKTLVELS